VIDELHAIGARTSDGEAENQPEAGQRGVAHVLVNRVRSRRWGPNLLSVCLWPHQFDCWFILADYKRITSIPSDDPRLQRYAEFLEDAEQGEPDPTMGAMYYKVSGTPWPADWGTQVAPVWSVGQHSFYILKEGNQNVAPTLIS